MQLTILMNQDTTHYNMLLYLLASRVLPPDLTVLPLKIFSLGESLRKKATINQLTTSKNVLFPGHNPLLTISADDPSL